jgi:secreted trypsin-like serine protease
MPLSLRRGLPFLLASLAVTVAMLLATTAPRAAAVEDPGGSTPAIIDGSYALYGPWAARLFVDGQENCSATIIAPSYILTARHCVESPGTYTFRIGSLDQTSGGSVRTGGAITRHPTADLAIVRLFFPVLTTYSPLGTPTDVAAGQSVRVYGWGATCTDKPEIQCQSRFLKVATVQVASLNCRDPYGGLAVCAQRVTGITAGGDSGGPMFASGRQVGVASTSDRLTNTAYTNLTQYRSWIRSIAGV